ncbi:MAG: acetate--CoA ligase family protein [Beijerinckiaceae bacterium]
MSLASREFDESIPRDDRAKSSHALDSFFSPQSVAIVGASPDATKIRGLLQSMLQKNGYPGALYPVNPNYQEIAGIPCFASIGAIGKPVDLALIVIPAGLVLAALEECARAQVRHAIIISSGFAEEGGDSVAIQHDIAELARRTGMRISGPNAEGFHNELGHVAATFSPAVDLKPGAVRHVVSERRIGIVAQSGGMGFALYNRGRAMGLSFSTIVSTGNECDLGASDFLDYMVRDENTDVVMLFLESVRDPKTFLAAAAEAARIGKPIVVSKVGQSGAGERAAASHTASMTGWNAAYKAAFAKYGLIEAADPDEAVGVAAALASAPLPKGNRAAIITVSGGAGAWAADVLAANGVVLPELSSDLQTKMRALIPSYGSARNPVDITAQGVHTGGLQQTIDLLAECDEIDLIVLVTSLSSEHRKVFDVEATRAIVRAQRKPILVYSYTIPSEFSRGRMAEAGLPVFANLADIGKACRRIIARARFAPPAEPVRARINVPKDLLRKASATSGCLSEYDSKALLRACGLAIGPEHLVISVDELDAAMQGVGFPLAMKIQSANLPHKSDVGGVRLAIADEESGRRAYEAMLADVRAQRPDAAIQGVLVSPMAPPGVEMIVGTMHDATFGPMIMVGLGGVTTELYGDVVYRLAPVGVAEATAMLAELKGTPLLKGFRGAPPADVPALASLIARVSAIAEALGDAVAEIELNPVIVYPAGQGVTIADALVVRARPLKKSP